MRKATYTNEIGRPSITDDRRRAELAASGFVKASEAAKFLGISESRVNQLRRAGLLSYGVVGGKFVYPRKALIDYMAPRIELGSVA